MFKWYGHNKFQKLKINSHFIVNIMAYKGFILFLIFLSNLLKHIYHRKESFGIILAHVIPNRLFFLQKINPRIASRMTANAKVTEPAMVEVFEVFVRIVLAKRFKDVVLGWAERYFIKSLKMFIFPNTKIMKFILLIIKLRFAVWVFLFKEIVSDLHIILFTILKFYFE